MIFYIIMFSLIPHVLLGMNDRTIDDLKLEERSTEEYEYEIPRGCPIIIDLTTVERNVVITSIPQTHDPLWCVPHVVYNTSLYQAVANKVYPLWHGLVSQMIQYKNAYKQSISAEIVYRQRCSRSEHLKPFEYTYTNGKNQNITIKPKLKIADYYQFVVPSDSPLTVMSAKDIVYKTAIGHIYIEEKDSNHPLYQKEERIINNIPNANYEPPHIKLISKKGAVLIKIFVKKSDNSSGSENK